MNAISERSASGSGAGLIAGFQQRLLRQLEVQVADWLDTCRGLADWEDRELVERSSSDRLAEHAAMLDELERAGRWFAEASFSRGPDLDPVRQQIQFALEDLRDSRAMWHHPVESERKAAILRECFNES